MKLGVNLTSPQHLNVVGALLRSGKASFCELLLDNFLHLDPRAIRDGLGDFPVAFHLMSSQFLEADPSALRELAGRVRHHVRELSPLYVSDHVARFSIDGRQLPLLVECNYEEDFRQISQRVDLWQSLLRTRLFLENFPSSLPSGRNQASFFAELLSTTGAGVLFDFSNALVAEKNCGARAAQWHLPEGSRFHVGGYRPGAEGGALLVDSHDCPISDESLKLIASLRPEDGATLVVERDANITFDSWAFDLDRVREASCST